MRVTALVPLMVLAQVATACQSGGPSALPSSGGDEIVIASDLPTSAGADFAIPLQQAIELAVRQQGRIATFKLVYLPLDDSSGSNPSQAKGVQNVKRMISDSRVLGMIGPATSTTTYAEIPVANAANLVMLSPTATQVCVTLPAPYCSAQPADLRANGPSNYFRISPPESLQGRAMARFATGTLNVQRVAAFNEWPDQGESVIGSFKDELVRAGGTLVLRRDLASGTSDFTSFLAGAQANAAQAIYAVTGGADDHACAAAAQAKSEFPGGVYFLGTDAITGSECIKDAVANANGMLGTLPDVDVTQSKDQVAQQVVEAYRKAYPNTSDLGFNTYIFAAYDCARLLIDAISRAIQANNGRIPTRPQVLAAVAHTQGFKGVTGTYSFDANGDAISPLMSIYEVQNGQWVYRQQLDASAKPS